MSNKTSDSVNLFDMLKAWLTSLPTDIKILIEMVGDEQLKLEARTMAVGTVFYILSPLDLIPEKIPVLGHVDDVVILRIALATIMRIDSERAVYYREKYPDICAELDEIMCRLEEMLGALYSWLTALVEALKNRRFHGWSTEDVVGSEQAQEELFDEAMEYAAGVNVDSKAIERALLGTPPDRIVGLLSQGLEEDQKRQLKDDKTGLVKTLTDASEGLHRLLERRGDSDAAGSAKLLSADEG